MSNPFVNFCYNIAGKREDMEVDQENQPRTEKARQKKACAAARKALFKRAQDIRRHNIAVKMEAYRAVRRPGKNHSHLLQVLDQLLGNLDTKKGVVGEVVEEALRFKRRALAQILEEYMVEMEMNENNERAGVCAQCALVRGVSSCTCKGRNIG